MALWAHSAGLRLGHKKDVTSRLPLFVYPLGDKGFLWSTTIASLRCPIPEQGDGGNMSNGAGPDHNHLFCSKQHRIQLSLVGLKSKTSHLAPLSLTRLLGQLTMKITSDKKNDFGNNPLLPCWLSFVKWATFLFFIWKNVQT